MFPVHRTSVLFCTVGLLLAGSGSALALEPTGPALASVAPLPLVSRPRRCRPRRAGRGPAPELSGLSDEELIALARDLDEAGASSALAVLYERFYGRVSYWCLRSCGDRDLASDLAQEVFLRVHTRLHTFRAESRFATWLYRVTRSVAINKGKEARRKRADESIDAEGWPEPEDPAPDELDELERREIAARLWRAMERDLDPLEAKVLYLHFADGLTLSGITDLLELTNRSGAKAPLVRARRKLERGFGVWLEGHLAGARESAGGIA